jgi:hypothetical protein
VNRGGRCGAGDGAWVRLIGWTGVRRGPVGSGRGAREKEREMQGGGGASTCWPERHSAGRRGSNLI